MWTVYSMFLKGKNAILKIKKIKWLFCIMVEETVFHHMA